jgi:hypothetical protein
MFFRISAPPPKLLSCWILGFSENLDDLGDRFIIDIRLYTWYSAIMLGRSSSIFSVQFSFILYIYLTKNFMFLTSFNISDFGIFWFTTWSRNKRSMFFLMLPQFLSLYIFNNKRQGTMHHFQQYSRLPPQNCPSMLTPSYLWKKTRVIEKFW